MLASFRRRSTPNGSANATGDSSKVSSDGTNASTLSPVHSRSSVSAPAGASPLAGSLDRRKSWPWASIGQMSARLKIARGRTDAMTLEEEEESLHSLGAFFFALPTELQLQIILQLSTKEIIQCRRVSRTFRNLIHTHEKSIAVVTANRDLPTFALRLYPPLQRPNVRYMIQMQRRLRVAAQLSGCIIDFIAVEFMRLRSKAELRSFREDRARALTTMLPLVFALYHFYEQWRWETMCRFDAKCQAAGITDPTSTTASANITWTDADAAECFRSILSSYSPARLQKCIQIDKLVLRVFHRQLRPPSYATGPERALRGWRAKPPRFGDLHTTKMLGGLDVVKQVLSQRKYTTKVQYVETFIQKMSPTENVNWRRTWQTLIHGPFADQEPPVRPVVGLVDGKLKILPWWHGGWDAWSAHVEENGLYVMQPREYIREILGYDVLQRPGQGGNAQMDGPAAQLDEGDLEADEVEYELDSDVEAQVESAEEDPDWTYADDNDWWS